MWLAYFPSARISTPKPKGTARPCGCCRLTNQIVQLELKPPVTLALVAVNLLLYFGLDLVPRGLVPSVWESCLQPRLILERGQWKRLLLSAFLHADEGHVYFNMSSLVWKGRRA
ncbi:hypothetical protein TSOC_001334 [Tetrabaena socialis]|uniref:Peptidase S54 rhomboid domain-containing protein n=1 Tax=Tetrabaena socialis TaxID=47790 RepID=A0A2J8AH34_9CHLO|nr:hypothetical protein TSOC_001334 [Tetrabaena socialis]|eukprot:PNH11838.1 hypothetical protein TSOC_001334 [Tetrabaena socialis]